MESTFMPIIDGFVEWQLNSWYYITNNMITAFKKNFTFIGMTLRIKTCTEFNIATWLKIVECTELNIWERNFETNEIFLSVS